MNRAGFYLTVLLVTLCVLIPASRLSFAASVDDYLYEPSVEFLDDFFLTFAEGGYIYPEVDDAALVLRRLYSFSDSVNSQDYVTAWQTLVNLPDHPGYPEVSDLITGSRAIQSVIPWMKDKHLKQNFMDCYDEIWLKTDGINEDYEKFRAVFSGFASRQEGAHPAAFVRSHLSYYGYNRLPDQPSEDMEFLFNLFNDFSYYAGLALAFDVDFRNIDPSDFSKLYMQNVADKIDNAWNTAVSAERERTGDSTLLVDETPQILKELESIPPVKAIEMNEPEIIDYEKVNVFKLPDGIQPIQRTTEYWEEPISPIESVVHVVDAEEPETEVVNPLENGGLEPPEKVTEIPNVEIEEIPIAEPEIDPAIESANREDIPVSIQEIKPIKTEPDVSETETINPEIIETEPEPLEDTPVETMEAEEVESVFVSPNVVMVEPQKEKPIPEKVVEIPTVEKKPVTETTEPEISEETPEVVNLLDQPSKPVTETAPAKTAPVVVAPVIPEPVEIKPVVEEPVKIEPEKPAIKTAAEEQTELAENLTDRTLVVAEKLGQYAVDLVVLWSVEPDSDPKYAEREIALEENFRVNKEEFLALLFINDAFRLEKDLGTSFDALNGRIIDSLMKGYMKFKNEGGLGDNPNVSDEELLRAIGQLTNGVESRRDSIKIQSASLKAFRLRRGQFETEIAKLEQLKHIEISK